MHVPRSFTVSLPAKQTILSTSILDYVCAYEYLNTLNCNSVTVATIFLIMT